MSPSRGATYHKLPDYELSRQNSLRKMFTPYIRVTDDYGRLICSAVDILGGLPSTSVQDRVVRDLLSDVFDFLYEARRIIMSGQCATAYPLLRRAFESLSLMVVCTFDSAVAERWHSGVQIPNRDVRNKLAAHPMGESEASMREAYAFFSDVAHPNRLIIPGRHLGDGNEFVLASIMMPDLCLVTEYCHRHLQLWFWFAAAVSHHYADLLHERDTEYHSDYHQAAQAAQVTAPILQSEFNRLLKEAQAANANDRNA
jgi:hypothetical protein